jgi:hypothetical protein
LTSNVLVWFRWFAGGLVAVCVFGGCFCILGVDRLIFQARK